MAMRIAAVPYFWATVSFYMIGDLDQSIECSFQVKYKRLEQEQYEKLLLRVQAARLAALTRQVAPRAEGKAVDQASEAPAEAGLTDRQVIDEVVLDWREVLGDDDQNLPFTKDNLDNLLKALGCRAAIVKQFFDLHNKELEKNSARPLATTTGT